MKPVSTTRRTPNHTHTLHTMKLYTLNAIESLISKYLNGGGEMHTIREGSLGYGSLLLTGEGLKSCIVTERYFNDSSSGHSVRFYNNTPKKYQYLI